MIWEVFFPQNLSPLLLSQKEATLQFMQFLFFGGQPSTLHIYKTNAHKFANCRHFEFILAPVSLNSNEAAAIEK